MLGGDAFRARADFLPSCGNSRGYTSAEVRHQVSGGRPSVTLLGPCTPTRTGLATMLEYVVLRVHYRSVPGVGAQVSIRSP